MMARGDDYAEKRENEHGYRETSGKAVRLAEWTFHREKREFAVLVNRLRVRKWQRDARANPEKHERLKARLRAWERKNRERNRDKLRAKIRDHHRKVRRANPIVRTCPGCGATWCLLPTTKPAAWKFCTNNCRQRWRYHHDPEYRARQLANVARWKSQGPRKARAA